MRIAIIGSGVSGLTAAYVLAPHATVTLYESTRTLGGHADTHEVSFGAKRISVDTGFMVFNPVRYPQFSKLITHLGVRTEDTRMSFSVTVDTVLSYSSSFSGIFGSFRNLTNVAFLQLIYSIPQFNKIARHSLNDMRTMDMPLGDFLDMHAISQPLREWYLYPMLGAIWSCPTKDVPSFPTGATLSFLHNHNLLQIIGGPVWQTISGGSHTYVKKIEEYVRAHNSVIYTDTTVTRIERTATHAIVHTETGAETYDWVLCATHADTALTLLHDPSEDERAVLGAFAYSHNTTVLHSYEGALPPQKRLWSSWNYRAHTDTHAHTTAVTVTYHMNQLQNIPNEYPLLVTLNPTFEIPPKYVHAIRTYTHPKYSSLSYRAQQQLPLIQGKNRVLFAGAHWGYGFHEDGVVSALNACAHLGIHPPWT